MNKQILIMLYLPFFFNIMVAGPVTDLTQAPRIKRLSVQDRRDRIEMQRQELRNNSPKKLRPIGKALSVVTTTVKQKSRSVSTLKR